MPRPWVAPLAVSLLLSARLPAQRLAQPLRSSPAPSLLTRADPRPLSASAADGNADAVRLVMGGVGLGIVGVVLGGYAGAKIEENGGCTGEDFCGLAGALLGATIGETLLLPAGVHVANHARGSYLLAVGATSLVAVGVWTVALGANNGTVLLAIPAGQLITAALVELHTAATPRAP